MYSICMRSLVRVQALENSRMLKLYSELDPRVRQLGYILKVFAKVRQTILTPEQIAWKMYSYIIVHSICTLYLYCTFYVILFINNMSYSIPICTFLMLSLEVLIVSLKTWKFIKIYSETISLMEFSIWLLNSCLTSETRRKRRWAVMRIFWCCCTTSSVANRTSFPFFKR